MRVLCLYLRLLFFITIKKSNLVPILCTNDLPLIRIVCPTNKIIFKISENNSTPILFHFNIWK